MNDESTLQRITGACPFLTWRRSGIILGRGLVRCAKMHLCHIPQRAWPVHFHQFSGGLFYAQRNPPAQPHTEFFAFALQPVDERLAGEDRRRRYRNVRFRFWALFDGELATVLEQGRINHPRIRKLVRQRARASRLSLQQIFYHARVAPAEQPVKITKLLVKLVVLRRSDQNGFHQTQRSFPNRVRKRANPCVGSDSLAVHHAGIDQFASNPTVDVRSGNHQRPEEIALPALIDTEMRLEHFWGMYFLVAELRFAKNFRLQLELHELLHVTALHEYLRSLLINRHAQLVFLRKEKCVFLRRKFKTKLFKQRTKLRSLFLRQRVGVRIQRPTLNGQHSMFNHLL